jgi:lipoprotein-anchoring transpeptidase ErfK/SrfK
MSKQLLLTASLAALLAAFVPFTSQAQLALPFFTPPPSQTMQGLPPQMQVAPQATAPSDDEDNPLPARLQRQVIDYPSHEAPGTIIVDTPHTYLYYILGGGKAMRYGIGVGREGFTWSGVKSIARKAEWPDWYPPSEMIQRQPYLPRMVAGGPGNPLGARALYIGGTEYRIHGTNAPSTIGHHVSSGCIRLRNADIIDLFSRVKVGAKVIVLPQNGRMEARVSQGTPSSIYQIR